MADTDLTNSVAFPADAQPDKAAVITGVSTGIGAGLAKVMSQSGWLVFGSVRKIEDAERMKSDLGARFLPLIFDVTDELAVLAAAQTVREALQGSRLSVLVNNAGITQAGPLTLQPTEDFRKQIETNLVGPFIVTKAFAPLLGTDSALTGKPGRIVNISSVGGRMGPPFLGAYAASKHGLEGMSESLRREMMLYGIGVVIVGPGAVATPIWSKGDPNDNQYLTTPYGSAIKTFFNSMIAAVQDGYTPEEAGRQILRIIEKPRPAVRYPLVRQPLRNWVLPMILPRRIVDRTIARVLKFSL
jgi:NAD(P)-dependent dehydrogenase (short-subunit alcohol dehydrogenase family)